MEPVDQTPTEPANYAAISLTYGTLLAALAYTTRERAAGAAGLDRELVPLVAASFSLSKLIAKEKVESWVRQPFVDEEAEGRPPKGTGMRYAVGELLTCSRCLGAWTALGLVGLRMAAPDVGRTVTTVLATSAGNDFLQAGFTYLTHKADAEGAKLANLED